MTDDSAALPAGQTKLNGLAAGGFSTDEVNQYRDRVSGQMAGAGFNQQEINGYWGIKTPDTSGVQNIAATNDKPGALTPANPEMRKELMGSYQRGETKNPDEFAQAAAGSIKDMAKVAASTLAKDEAYILTSTPGSMTSDIIQNTVNLPVAGATRLLGRAYQELGGEMSVPVAEALTQGIPEFGKIPGQNMVREALQKKVDYQPETPAGEVTQATMGIAPYLMGGEGSAVRKAAGAVASGAGTVAGKDVAKEMGFGETGQQVGAIIGGAPGMVYGASGGEHEGWPAAPKAQDFPNAAIATNGPKAETEVSQVLRNIYAEQGIHPAQVAADAKINPTIPQDLAAGKIPEAYAPQKQPEAPTAPIPAQPATPMPGNEAAAPKASGSIYEMIKPSELTLDPERFQYKASEAGGVTGALQGVTKWEDALANPITVWRSNDGKTYVVNGHQRFDLAARAAGAGQDVQMPARVYKESDGYSPDFMRTLGAFQNIAEGSGTAIDAAKILRSGKLPEDRELPQLPPKSQLVQQANGLAALDDRSFGMVVNDMVPASYAAEVGHAITDPRDQLAAMDVLAKNPPANTAQARIMVQDIRNSGFHTSTQTGLFGDEQLAQSLFAERARILDNAVRQLRQLKTAFGVATNFEGALTEVGNVLDKKSNVKAKASNEKIIAELQANGTRKGPISDALSDAARELKSGKSAAAATKQFLDRTRGLATGATEQGIRPGNPAGGNEPAPESAARTKQGLIQVNAETAKELVENPHQMTPDRTVTPGIQRGEDVQYQSGQLNKEALFKKAEQYKPPYEEWIREVTDGIKGAEPYKEGIGGPSGVRVKHRTGRIDEKIADKDGNAGAISDYLGGAIEVASPEAMQSVLERIGASGKKILEVEDMLTADDKEKDDGYRAIHMQVMMEPGFSAELQIIPKSVAKIKETLHPEYVKLRDAEGNETPASEAARKKMVGEYQKAFDKFQGKPAQAEIEGAAPTGATNRKLAEQNMEGRDRAGVAQKPADEGLFDVGGRSQTAMFQRPTAPTFYSALEKGLTDLPQAKATGEQWSGIIKNLKGIKQEEVDWSGVQDWLKEQKGSVTKQQVLDYLKANKIDVQEVVKSSGEKSLTADEALESINRGEDVFYNAPGHEGRGPLDAQDIEAMRSDREITFHTQVSKEETKFSSYQTPGGENYRELLMTLPENSDLVAKKADEEGTTYRTASANTSFRGGHFDEPNVLAHLRFNERTDADGKKTMFIEEVQSDWHQKGRMQGYQGNEPPAIKPEEVEAKFIKSTVPEGHNPENYPGYWELFDRRTGEMITRAGGKLSESEAINDAVNLSESDRRAAERKFVPDAPFKTTWPELAFKRALRWAVENGMDKVAWTTGEQQAARYDLSKQVESIDYKKNSEGTYYLSAQVNGRGQVLGGALTEKELADHVGKDVAQKIIAGEGKEVNYGANNEPKNIMKSLSGIDLKVGGQGMKGFYDKILPATVNKLVKKWGAKVEETDIDTKKSVYGEPKFDATETPQGKWAALVNGIDVQRLKRYATKDEALNAAKDYKQPKEQTLVHSVEITPEMRDSVMQGQPLFNREGDSNKVPENAVHVAPGLAAVPKEIYTAKEAKLVETVNKVAERILGKAADVRISEQLYSTGTHGEPGKVEGYSNRVLNNKEVRDLIHASMTSTDLEGTIRHETIHNLKSAGKFKPEEWSALEQAAKDGDWIGKHDVVNRWKGLDEEKQTEESIAEEFNKTRPNDFKAAPEAIRPIFQKLARFFDAVRDGVRQVLGKDVTAQDVFSRIETGEVGRRAGDDGASGGSFQTPEDKILNKISIGEPRTHRPPMSWNAFYKAAVDKFDPIRRITDDLQKGDKTDVLRDTYKLMRNLAGNYGRAQQFIEQHTFDFKTYENTGKGLKAILEPVQQDMNGFRAYAASRRAIELEDRGIKSGMDANAAKQVVAAGAERYEPIFKELNGYQDAVLKYLKDSGVLTDDQLAAMKGANKAYVPYYRVMDEDSVGLGGDKIKNPIKRIKGSERDIIDPVESIVRNTYSYIAIAERNAAAKSFFDLASQQEHPEDYFTKQAPALKPTKISEDEMNAFLKKEGIEDTPENTLTVFRAMRTPLARDEVGFFDKGKWTVMKVDPELAEAFNGTPRAQHGFLFSMIAAPAKMLRYGLVTPEFIIRHLERNTLSATVIGSKGQIPFENVYKGIFSYLHKDEAYEGWLKSGGKVSALSGLSRDDVQDQVRRITAEAPEANFLGKAWNIARTPFDVIHALQQNLENIGRLGAYKRAMEGLKTNKSNVIDAGYYSRNVAPDPARIGTHTGAWNAITALANTEIQHTAQLVDALRNRPIPTLAKGFAFITLPTIINWALNHNSDQWKEARDWERDAFWIVPAGAYALRIPKPFFMGFMFATVPERILDAISGNDKTGKGLAAGLKDMFEQATPNTIPTALTPILEQITNHSMFRGMPLVPDHLMKELPEYRYSEYTSELTKAVGKLVGTVPYVGGTTSASPIVIDNYLRAWTGALGTYTYQAADASLRKAGVLPDPLLPASTLADIPFVKAFVVRYPSATAASIQHFQDDYKSMSMVTNTFKDLMKQGEYSQAQKLLLNNPAAFYKLDKIDKTLTENNQMVRLLYKNPSIPADQKRQLIDSIYYNMIQISRAGNNLLDAIQHQPAAKAQAK